MISAFKIHISETTKLCIENQDQYSIEERGQIEVKVTLCSIIQVALLFGGYISLLLLRWPKLPSKCNPNGLDNLGNQCSNKEIQSYMMFIWLQGKGQMTTYWLAANDNHSSSETTVRTSSTTSATSATSEEDYFLKCKLTPDTK